MLAPVGQLSNYDQMHGMQQCHVFLNCCHVEKMTQIEIEIEREREGGGGRERE